MKTLIIIPSLNPSLDLIDYVSLLTQYSNLDVLIVNDGSDSQYQPIFDTLNQLSQVTVLTHTVNLGKGRALKNAFNYYLNSTTKYNGAISVDSDGQHQIVDVLKIVKILNTKVDGLILGCRNFDETHVPFKSAFGNKLTRFTFRLLYGKKISDTQTGLRAFPNQIISKMIDIDGERFEYETKMLIEVIKQNIPIYEVEITTVYFGNNEHSHFNPINDSIKIYKVIFASFFKFILSSISAFVIDILSFYLIYMLFNSSHLIVLSTIIARIISSTYNYFMNKVFVFNTQQGQYSMIKYWSLCIGIMLLSALLLHTMSQFISGNIVLLKICIDSVLFIISYQLQKKWVFSHQNNRINYNLISEI